MMTQQKKRWPSAQARLVADWFVGHLESYADRIEVAGSLRRGLGDVGDVEIVYVPRWGEGEQNKELAMFAEPPPPVDLVDRRIGEMQRSGQIERRFSASGRQGAYGANTKHLVSVSTGIPIDVFRATAENWGMAMMVRTGPAEWSHLMMSLFKQRGMEGHVSSGVTTEGALNERTEIACPTEETVFELLGIPYRGPMNRDPQVIERILQDPDLIRQRRPKRR